MRFHGLDLNLLVALDVLLAEQNVSRAALKLHLTQSATSSALARLREHFGDQLLVPLGRRMVMTPRALELSQAVRDILLQVQSRVLERSEFNSSTTHRTFTIFATDYMTITCLSGALRAMAKTAPNMKFEIMEPEDSPSASLDHGDVDFLVMPDFYVHPDHPSEALFEDTFSCIVWSGSDAFGETLSFEDYVAARQVIVRIGHGRTSRFDDWFDEQYGTVRHVDVVAQHYSIAPFLVIGTNRVATLQTRIAKTFAALLPVRLIEPPLGIPGMKECIQWHRYNDNDAAVLWVKENIKASIQPV